MRWLPLVLLAVGCGDMTGSPMMTSPDASTMMAGPDGMMMGTADAQAAPPTAAELLGEARDLHEGRRRLRDRLGRGAGRSRSAG